MSSRPSLLLATCGLLAALLLLLLSPISLAAPAPGSDLAARTSTELAKLSRGGGSAADLWRALSEAAAAQVAASLQEHLGGSHTVELDDVDLDALRIWHGSTVTLGLQADAQPYKFVVQSEPEWRRLAEVLPAAQGGLLPSSDWETLERDWLSPVAHGSLLPDFALEGPLDLVLPQPTALQLFLPHATDVGDNVRRVLLRRGAAVLVRGARSVRLRRGLDLPPIGLSEFAGIVAADAGQQQPLGVMHLLAGVQAAAAAHWNESHPDSSLGLVALELDLAPRGAALLAAPARGGGTRRLRVRPVAGAQRSAGTIELLARDAPPRAAAQDGALALASTAVEGAWPLTSVHPQQLQSYERLLRQVVSSRLVQAEGMASRGGKAKGGSSGAGSGSSGQPALRVVQDVQLRLKETEAEATTLLQMEIDVVRRPLGAAAKGGGSKGTAGGSEQGAGSGGGGQLAVMEDPPDPFHVAAHAAGRMGPHETWGATVQVKGDAQHGNLRFVPLMLRRIGASHDTVHLAPDALAALFGQHGNDTTAGMGAPDI